LRPPALARSSPRAYHRRSSLPPHASNRSFHTARRLGRSRRTPERTVRYSDAVLGSFKRRSAGNRRSCGTRRSCRLQRNPRETRRQTHGDREPHIAAGLDQTKDYRRTQGRQRCPLARSPICGAPVSPTGPGHFCPCFRVASRSGTGVLPVLLKSLPGSEGLADRGKLTPWRTGFIVRPALSDPS